VILVQGTEDFTRVNKQQKIWFTRCRYATLEINLQYIDFTATGIVIETVAYDAKGNRIVAPTQDAQIINPSAVVDGSTLDVTVSFTSAKELNLFEFRLNKEIKGIGDLGTIETFGPKGVGSIYTKVDDTGDRGTFTYSVFAAFPDTPGGQYGKLCATIEDVVV
jgi:hypothetical protein